MGGRNVELRGKWTGRVRRRGQGGRPLGDFWLQCGERIEDRQRGLDGVGARARVPGLARMNSLAMDAYQEREKAEAAGPDARSCGTVEVENVTFEQALFRQIADAGIKPAFLVSAKQQHRVVGERKTDRVGGA